MAKSWQPDSSFMPMNRGGDGWVARPDFSPDSNGTHINGSNAYLERTNPSTKQAERVFLWVNELTSDFSLAGTSGQSKSKRSFFPHNFTQPSLKIAGQMPNNYQYNRLAQFVRQSQLDAVRLKAASADEFLRFRLFSTGPDVKHNHRGAHQQIDVDGYVAMMRAGAERFVNAPDYDFEFIITKANRPVSFLGLHDEVVKRIRIQSITHIFKDSKFGFSFETDPLPSEKDFPEVEVDPEAPRSPIPWGGQRP